MVQSLWTMYGAISLEYVCMYVSNVSLQQFVASRSVYFDLILYSKESVASIQCLHTLLGVVCISFHLTFFVVIFIQLFHITLFYFFFNVCNFSMLVFRFTTSAQTHYSLHQYRDVINDLYVLELQ